MRAVVVAGLAVAGLVIDGGVASAAPAYQLIAVDAGGTALSGTTTFATASEDGSIVAALPAERRRLHRSQRDLAAQPPNGGDDIGGRRPLPVDHPDRRMVAFVSCDGKVSVREGAQDAAGAGRRLA